MTSVAPKLTPESADPSGRAGRPRATRALELGAVLFVLGGVALVGASAAPAALRHLGITRARVVERDFAHTAPVGRVGIDAVHDFEKGIGRSVDKLEQQEEERELAPSHDTTRLVFPARDVVLRRNPSAKAQQVGFARRGDPLVVQTEEGGWVLVAHITEDGLEAGWVPRPDVSLP